MNYFKQLNFPIFDSMYEELNDMIGRSLISWGSNNQICINTIPQDLDNYDLGTGSLVYDWSNSYKIDENGVSRIIVPPRDFSLKEKDFSEVCSQFKGTVFEKMFNMLSQRYSLGRVRIMKSEPKTCMSWHIDDTPRIHFPIKTQRGCFMAIENEIFHLPEKTWWWTDTTKEHTAFNASKESRIHIVAVIL